jgi:GxxExxY protein
MGELKYGDLTYKIRGALFEVYNLLGPGFKETIYHNALREEFIEREIRYKEKRRINVNFKGKQVGAYEPDFVVEDKVILEIKAVEIMPKLFEQQIFNYLKATGFNVGFLINFGGKTLDIRRRIYG